jgi:hypothetical protein
VVDQIPSAGEAEIRAALPHISSALKSTKDNLPVEAMFALYVIAQRPDGGAILRQKVADIGDLLNSTDSRINGGAVLTLKFLTPSNRDMTLPIVVNYLTGEAPPSPLKAEIVSTLLAFESTNAQSMNAVEQFLLIKADAPTNIATLHALAVNHIHTAAIDDYVLRSLSEPSKFVKLASIHAAQSLGPEAWNKFSSRIAKLSVDPSEDNAVRDAARAAIFR